MSVLQSMPVFLIPVQSNVQNARHISTQCAAQLPMQKQSSTEKFVPTIIQDSQELEESPNNVAGQTEESSRGLVQQRPFVQPRLRKILPKPDFLIVPNINDSPGVLNTLQSISPPKSDICFVPNVANPTPNGSAITRPLRYPGNMRAVLRISINKHRNDDGPYNEPIDISSDEADKIRSTDRADSSSKEITIENTSTNKAVTFRLDPESGEIVVTTQRMDDSSRDEEDEETTRTERKVDYAYVLYSIERSRLSKTTDKRNQALGILVYKYKFEPLKTRAIYPMEYFCFFMQNQDHYDACKERLFYRLIQLVVGYLILFLILQFLGCRKYCPVAQILFLCSA